MTPFDFLQLQDKWILVMGVANKKSVAWQSAQVLKGAGAKIIYVVRSNERQGQIRKLLGNDASPVLVCDVEFQEQIDRLKVEVGEILSMGNSDQTNAHIQETKHNTQLANDVEIKQETSLFGILHSIAFADYSSGWLPFQDTPRDAFLRSMNISCYSLVAVTKAMSELLDKEQGSVVTVSISTTRMAAENYGYMAPIKAALDSSLCFLAKSYSMQSKIRFNAVCPGLLKTSASAGIPGYIDSYLHAEKATLRKEAVQTIEVANTIAFLLSPRSSGINSQGIVVDAGMSTNYFDNELIAKDM